MAKRKSIAKNATPDPRSVEIPPVPAHWSEVTDPVSKRRAVLIWQDAHRLKIVGDIWQQWFRSLKAHGDADPIVPIRCRETIDRCLEVLWPYLTQIVPYLGTSLRDFKSRLPAMPSGRLADGEYPGWQKDSELWSSFYGDLNRGSGALRGLYGGATELLRRLSHDPESFVMNHPLPKTLAPAESAADLEQPSKQGLTGTGESPEIAAVGSKSIEQRVGRVERQLQIAKKPTQAQRIRNQRIKFSCPRRRREEPEQWPKIYEAYSEKYPDDKTASSDTMRLSHERNCLKCRNSTDS